MRNIFEKVETERDSLGRRIKSDKNIFLCGVASYPKPVNANNWTADDRQNYELWKAQTLEFLKSEYEDNLLCVLEHTDEKYPHFHFYAANKARVADTPKLHPGHAENIRFEEEAKKSGGKPDKRAMTTAYRKAMSEFQDKYYNEV